MFRSQTAFATIYTLLIPYIYAGGKELIIPLLLTGFLVHYSSFGHNSVMNYYHDLKDENKKHHPLMNGRIRYEDSVKVVNYMQIITSIILVTFSVVSHNLVSLVFLLLYVVFGHAYNDGLDHVTLYSWLPISIAFASLTVYSLTLYDYNMMLLLLFFLLGFNTILYQIAYEGNKKDYGHEDNLYTRYGMYSNNKGLTTKIFEYGFMLDRMLVNTIFIVMLIPHTILNFAILSIMTIVEGYSVYHVHYDKVTEHVKMLRHFGMAEAFEFVRIMSIIPPIYFLILAIIGVVYFVVMNKYLWGTDFAPRV